MKTKLQPIRFGLLAALSITPLVPNAGAQAALSCSTIPGASNYGTDLSVCHMPDQSSLECSQDRGGLSYCQISHPNGFVSHQGGGSAVEALTSLIVWMVHNHQQHTADKAREDAAAVVSLTIKHSVHLMDMSALTQQVAQRLPADQKDAWMNVSKNLADQSSAFSGAVSLFSKNWNNDTDASSFRREAKSLRNLYDSGLITVCKARLASQLLTGKLNPVRSQIQAQGPDGAQIIQALDAVRGDEMLFEPECNSERALKLLQNQPKMRDKN
jgi:hypothetical protein